MITHLIPVVGIGYNNMGVPYPSKYPWWEYPEIWDDYYREVHNKAGFVGPLTSYKPGYPFYPVNNLSYEHLRKLIVDFTEVFREDMSARDLFCPLFGGYILRINDKDEFFPQCCGDLSDIKFWRNLSTDRQNHYYAGHPRPSVGISSSKITLTCKDDSDEFRPSFTEEVIIIDKISLSQAYNVCLNELELFASKIEQINQEELLGIARISDLLIYGETNEYD